MLYLVDSSARSTLGHNLEYLERISSVIDSEFLILGHKNLDSDKTLRYRPTFEFATWDFGRFGIRRSKLKPRAAQSSKTLRFLRAYLITEKLIEMSATSLGRSAGKYVLSIVRLTKQSRCFRRDLSLGLFDIKPGSNVLISTANARELVGLSHLIDRFPIQRCPISIILRRPLLDLRSYFEIPFLFFDALIYASAIRELEDKVRFFADTPGLVARLSKQTSKTIQYIPSLGFEMHLNNGKAPLEFAIAPNSRPETRFPIQNLTCIPELRASAEGNLDSKSYRDLLLTTKSIVLPYDPLRYRARSSGIFAEALTLGIIPIVPTGTSMSREITKLNSKILQAPDFVVDLEVGDSLDFRQFEGENMLITLGSNICTSIVLEISEKHHGVRRSIHDFYGSELMDSFLIRPTKQTLLSFKMDRRFFKSRDSLNIKLNRIQDASFGIPYLNGELLGVLSLTKRIAFSSEHLVRIKEHTPNSICGFLEI